MTTNKATEATHTPGPWHYRSHDGAGHLYGVRSASGAFVATVAKDFYPQAVNFAEAEANARLIALAPDMAHGLSTIVNMCERFQNNDAEGRDAESELAEAENAIRLILKLAARMTELIGGAS